MKRFLAMTESEQASARGNFRRLEEELLHMALKKDGMYGQYLLLGDDGKMGLKAIETSYGGIEKWEPVISVPTLWRPSQLESHLWDEVLSRMQRTTHVWSVIPVIIATADHHPRILFELTRDIDVEEFLYNWIQAKEQALLNGVFRACDDLEYYFDHDWVVRSRQRSYGKVRSLGFYPGHVGPISLNRRTWHVAASAWEDGTTLAECIHSYVNTLIEIKFNGYSFLDRLCTVMKPSFERATGNNNKKTFDWIRVEVSLTSGMYGSWEELAAAVRENRDAIDELVIDKIQSSKRFQSFGVPVNFLRIKSIEFTPASMLEYVFELKQM